MLALLAACASGRTSTAPVPASGTDAVRIVDAGSGRSIPFSRMADEVSTADVVFFGEQHDDVETHRAELSLLTAIGERRRPVVLSLEMFERDVQPLVDAYLAGTITEVDFRARSRPWPNYEADYRPLLELAKAKHWPVVAANVPRRLASAVSRQGLTVIDTLGAVDRGYVARQLECPKGSDQYYINFLEVMGAGHGGAMPAATASPMSSMTDLFYDAQCIKDETMAESIVQARAAAGSAAIVVHFTGSFHTDFGLGTASRVRRRLPGAKTVVVSAVPTPDPATADATALIDRGQFIVIVRRAAPAR